jgi:hypothetical protein
MSDVTITKGSMMTRMGGEGKGGEGGRGRGRSHTYTCMMKQSSEQDTSGSVMDAKQLEQPSI